MHTLGHLISLCCVYVAHFRCSQIHFLPRDVSLKQQQHISSTHFCSFAGCYHLSAATNLGVNFINIPICPDSHCKYWGQKLHCTINVIQICRTWNLIMISKLSLTALHWDNAFNRGSATPQTSQIDLESHCSSNIITKLKKIDNLTAEGIVLSCSQLLLPPLRSSFCFHV